MLLGVFSLDQVHNVALGICFRPGSTSWGGCFWPGSTCYCDAFLRLGCACCWDVCFGLGCLNHLLCVPGNFVVFFMLVSFCLCVANEVYLVFIWCLLICYIMCCLYCWGCLHLTTFHVLHRVFEALKIYSIYEFTHIYVTCQSCVICIYRCISKVNMFLFITLTGWYRCICKMNTFLFIMLTGWCRCIYKVNMFLFISLTGCSSWFAQSLALPTLTLLSALRMTKVRKLRDPQSDIILVFNSGHDHDHLLGEWVCDQL